MKDKPSFFERIEQEYEAKQDKLNHCIQLWEMRDVIPKAKGFLVKRCPLCGKGLDRMQPCGEKDGYTYVRVFCSGQGCQYEFAVRNPLSLGASLRDTFKNL